MNRAVGIQFNSNQKDGVVGVLKYITGDVKDTAFQLIRYGNLALEHRYFVVINHCEIPLDSYVSYNDLERIDKAYMKQLNMNKNGFMALQLQNWDSRAA
ncbi:hypothetical protein DWB88_13530 (plasmid) [Staphylococcus warneri]|nr:hypothetical protein DWB88_13530 [Staphylococcus warneri]